MNAIVPLNITALRVSATDASNVVTAFKGREAAFDLVSWKERPSGSSTGDAITQPLESNDPPLATLNTGIHLHWELPDYFKKGVQSPESGKVIFPQAPNRWLVTRYLAKFDTRTEQWLPATSYSWIVESDYISKNQLKDSDEVTRPSVPVPLPVGAAFGEQPYRYMGRVVDAGSWPDRSPEDKYLRDFSDAEGNPFYLTAIGFLGPSFSSYYPDCCSVFGFCDRFLDDSDIYNAIHRSEPARFKVSYHVVGWIDGEDPLKGSTEILREEYRQKFELYKARGGKQPTPGNLLQNYMCEKFQGSVDASSARIWANENPDATESVTTELTLCNGIIQEIIWDQSKSPGSSGFLGNPDRATEPAVWEDREIRIALGNTATEALSALMGAEVPEENSSSYELLLNLLQTGKLDDIAHNRNLLARLEQEIHTDTFALHQGGLSWTVRKEEECGEPANPTKEVELPLPVAENLSLLNKAQKDYDRARNSLRVLRSQLFADWYRYIKIYSGAQNESNADLNTLSGYIKKSLENVISRGEQAGILEYYSADENGKEINGIRKPAGKEDSLASRTWNLFEAFRTELENDPKWKILAIPAPGFALPTDPVLALESKSLDCRQRNGTSETTLLRNSGQLIGRLQVEYGNFKTEISAGDLEEIPDVNKHIPAYLLIQQLFLEANLTLPSLADKIVTAISRKGGKGNPAVSDPETCLNALLAILGGESALESHPRNEGIFEKVHSADYIPAANETYSVESPAAMSAIFTNESNNGWLPPATAWNLQEQFPELSEKRYDPFLPVSLVWNAGFEPLRHDKDDLNYAEENLTRYFKYDDTKTEYTYHTEIPFTDEQPVLYSGSSILIKKAMEGVTRKIDACLNEASVGQEDHATLTGKKRGLSERKIVSETLSGLGKKMKQRSYIPRMNVTNLTAGKKDTITLSVGNAALHGNPGDNWYDDGFNTESPVAAGKSAISPFSPLRSGFLSVYPLEVVDVFGQRIRLFTPGWNKNKWLDIIPASSMALQNEDTARSGKAYLPPRIDTPSRIFFRWLSATWSGTNPAVKSEFTEMNLHPACTPVCGWILPNNLEHKLFFYDSNGNAIGSFGLEHGSLKYRTRPGNAANPEDDLTQDIGARNTPLVNRRLAGFMWYIQDKSGTEIRNGGFLSDLMDAILDSDRFISAENTPRDGSLAVLTGRPLALVRCTLSAESTGGTLPLNPSDRTPADPWPQDINNKRTDYYERMNYSSANLANINIPLRLGDVYNTDDGLIGYLKESSGEDPYGKGDFYAPSASPSGTHGVIAPPEENILLHLNQEEIHLTLLVDPRGAVHATTGIFPVAKLAIPADQYAKAATNLQMTFFTHPILQPSYGFKAPVPLQNGYVWSWFSYHLEEELPVEIPSGNDGAEWGYSPQTLEEGWLKLSPDPNPAE